MALGNVFMRDTDGNIPVVRNNTIENVCGLVFDISGQPDFWTKGVGAQIADTWKDKVVELTTLAEAEEAGITAYTGEIDSETNESNDLLSGIPYYHIRQFFNMAGGSGRLFVMFADCSKDWNALIEMQRAATGSIFQIGVWTEQQLWTKPDEAATAYSIGLVADLNRVAVELADEYFAPVSILLCANTSKVKVGTQTTDTIAISQIPSCVIDARYVTVLLSQSMEEQVRRMQASLASTTPVGCVGLALGTLTQAGVGESIGWVRQFDLVNYVPAIEMGFGDSTVSDGLIANGSSYSALSKAQLNALEEAGYVFIRVFEGLEGHTYFANDHTCSSGDFCTISRNRTINKSRRLIRLALLPYVNSPIKVDPSNGNLSSAQVTVFENLLKDILNEMESAEEISGTAFVTVPAEQNILVTKKLTLSYGIVPMGCAESIDVTEGLYVSQQ
ncbi:DUF2586 family protein [Xylanibacter muris]|uniref:DUF2586 family protein n=1 Tax=Bacteroidales TaxID=171549 RepID=UPI000FFEB03C|nr:DUF2586 family protein [Xylanibacter muris]RXE72188.1 hypothetical protein ED352_01670 [Muribaculaceae bacterium Isolate-002 (NCI)]